MHEQHEAQLRVDSASGRGVEVRMMASCVVMFSGAVLARAGSIDSQERVVSTISVVISSAPVTLS
jgi:hypothetical protein